MAKDAKAVLAEIRQGAAEFLKTQTSASGRIKDVVVVLSADIQEVVVIRVNDEGKAVYENFVKQAKPKPGSLSAKLESLVDAWITDQRAVMRQVAARQKIVKAALERGG